MPPESAKTSRIGKTRQGHTDSVELNGRRRIYAGESGDRGGRSKAGDRQAREELIEGNLRLVLSVIQRFAGRGESVDDLFQVGCVGLIKAIDNFDISQPVKFSTYGCLLYTSDAADE